MKIRNRKSYTLISKELSSSIKDKLIINIRSNACIKIVRETLKTGMI